MRRARCHCAGAAMPTRRILPGRTWSLPHRWFRSATTQSSHSINRPRAGLLQDVLGCGMSTAVAAGNTGVEGVRPAGAGGKKKLLLLAIPVILGIVGAGLWFSGVLPGLLGRTKAD